MFVFIHSCYIWLLDLILPRQCLGCRSDGAYLCDYCLEQLPRATETESGRDIYSLYDYNDHLVKKIIWRLKYRGVKELGRRLGQTLEINLARQLSLPQPILIIPIPLSPARLRERGFNQAELIAQGLISMNPRAYNLNNACLIKIRDTPMQVSMKNRRERLLNLHGAFGLRQPELIRGQTVLLIDDVLTTGGTLVEAKKVLERGGARRVLAATIAHG